MSQPVGLIAGEGKLLKPVYISMTLSIKTQPNDATSLMDGIGWRTVEHELKVKVPLWTSDFLNPCCSSRRWCADVDDIQDDSADRYCTARRLFSGRYNGCNGVGTCHLDSRILMLKIRVTRADTVA